MDKKKMSERSIITQYIIPAIENAGWDKKQIAEEVTFTDGKIIVRKKLVSRGTKKRADIILSYKSNSTNIPLAIIEAKDNKHSIRAGLMKVCSELELRIEKSKKYSEQLRESILKIIG